MRIKNVYIHNTQNIVQKDILNIHIHGQTTPENVQYPSLAASVSGCVGGTHHLIFLFFYI